MRRTVRKRTAIMLVIACVVLIAGATAQGATGRSSSNLPDRIVRDRTAAVVISVPASNNPHADEWAQATGTVTPAQTNHQEGAGS